MKRISILVLILCAYFVSVAWGQQPAATDPWIQLAKLTASDGQFDDSLGESVFISGNTVVAGARNAKIGGNSQQGAAYVFVKPASGWSNMTQVAKLTASDGAALDEFGFAVAISGNTIIVGAANAAGTAGAAYVFVKPKNGWADMTETAKLTGSDEGPGSGFGGSVAISGNTAVVSGVNDGGAGTGIE